MEHDEVKALMERWATKAATERSGRKLVLHTEAATAGTPAANPATAETQAAALATQNPTPLRRITHRGRLARWSIAASVAAAIVVGVVVFVTPEAESEAPVICMVNGERVTDPDCIAAYTREALELASDNLRRPGATLASTLGDSPTMTRVSQMLNELTNDK